VLGIGQYGVEVVISGVANEMICVIHKGINAHEECQVLDQVGEGPQHGLRVVCCDQ